VVRATTLALILIATGATAQEPTRAQYKNAVLGMTLAEWKALPFPDTIKPNEFTAPICTDNPKWARLNGPLPVSTVEQALGVVECGYYTDTKMKGDFLTPGLTFTGPSIISLGAEHTMFSVDYAFFQGRLFRIRGSSQLRGIDDMVDGLSARYGKPVTNKTVTQNGIGNTFPKVEYTWIVGSDAISASAPSARMDQSAVLFLDTGAAKRLDAAKSQINPATAKM